MRYRYVAAELSGKIIEGEIDAGNPSQVLGWMATHKYKPVSVKAIITETKSSIPLFSQKITLSDKVFITKYLALMLKVGTDLFRAIDILISDFEKPILKSFLMEVRESLSQGKPFYTTFAKYPQYFSLVMVSSSRLFGSSAFVCFPSLEWTEKQWRSVLLQRGRCFL